jgi:hypothetical protein
MNKPIHQSILIEKELGAVPLWQVQNKETPSLVYAWDAKLIEFVGLK